MFDRYFNSLSPILNGYFCISFSQNEKNDVIRQWVFTKRASSLESMICRGIVGNATRYILSGISGIICIVFLFDTILMVRSWTKKKS